MTVNDFEMRVRARGKGAGVEDADEERWKELADVRDGRREKWMTDRAKHALGTPKLASIFLREEKGRVHRLRKIKSVLASGNLMGNGGGATPYSTTQADKRGRRRPYGNLSQQNSHVYHMSRRRRFPKTEDANYPTNPFGNIGRDVLQFPESAMRRSSVAEAVRSCENDDSNGNSLDCSKGVWNDDRRAIQQVVSSLGASKGGLNGSKSDLDRISEAPVVREDQQVSSRFHLKEQNNGSEYTKERGQAQQGSDSHDGSSSRATAGKNQAISSGPSAIDLFDQCGLVPMDAVEKEGLVGTTSTFRPDHESDIYDEVYGKDILSSMTDRRYPVPPALIAPKPPLIPGGAFSTTTRNHARDAPARAPRESTKRSQAAIRHGVQPRPPFSGGSVSTSSRSKHDQHSQVAGGAARSSGKLRRGVQNEAAAAESTPRRSRMAGTLSSSTPSAQTIAPVAEIGGRMRRRWKVDEANPTAADSASPKSPREAKDVKPTEDKAPTTSASVSASEQRIASAKERLHKNKGLHALKSEHVEALSILQDISCPSTATMAAEVPCGIGTTSEENGTVGRNVEDGTVEAAKEALLHRREQISATAAGPDPNVRMGGSRGIPGDAEVDELSADLPRIGSQEQAALRTMYREWWMKVANGGSPPAVGASDNASRGRRLDLVHRNEAADPGVITSPVGQQPLSMEDQATKLTILGREGNTSSGRAVCEIAKAENVGGSPAGRGTLNSGVTDMSGDVSQEAPKKSPASEDTPVLESQAGQDKTSRGKKSCPNESACGLAEDSTADLSCDIGSNVSEMLCAASKTDNDRPSTEQKRAAARASPPLRAETEATPREDKGDAAEGTLATAGALVTSSPPTPPEASPQKQQQQQQQQQPQKQQLEQQQFSSEDESVSEDDDLEKDQEEGLHGRIYLPDGRFVSTLHRSGEMAGATKRISKLGGACWGDDSDDEIVADKSSPKADDGSRGYANEDFEFED